MSSIKSEGQEFKIRSYGSHSKSRKKSLVFYYLPSFKSFLFSLGSFFIKMLEISEVPALLKIIVVNHPKLYLKFLEFLHKSWTNFLQGLQSFLISIQFCAAPLDPRLETLFTVLFVQIKRSQVKRYVNQKPRFRNLPQGWISNGFEFYSKRVESRKIKMFRRKSP